MARIIIFPVRHEQNNLGLDFGTDWDQERCAWPHDSSASGWWIKRYTLNGKLKNESIHYYTLNNSCKLKPTIQAYRYMYLELQASLFYVIGPTDAVFNELRWFPGLFTFIYTPHLQNTLPLNLSRAYLPNTRMQPKYLFWILVCFGVYENAHLMCIFHVSQQTSVILVQVSAFEVTWHKYHITWPGLSGLLWPFPDISTHFWFTWSFLTFIIFK